MATGDIQALRKEVDKLDRKLWQILSARLDTAVQIRRLRKEPKDPAREDEILKRAREVSQGLLGGEFCADLMQRIIAESVRIQNLPLNLVSFRGLHGSFGEIAVKQFDSSGAPIPSLELSEVFEAVITESTDCAVVPLEGAVDETESEVLELLRSSSLSIVGEVNVEVKHALIILPGTSHREIQEVYSSVASLSKCRKFLKRNRLISKPVVESADAARMLARGEIDGAAVIAPAYAADFYGLEILKDYIDDRPNHFIRYVVLAKKPAKGGNRCSVTFDIQHKSGSLTEVLEVFREAKINLLSIQSIAHPESESSISFTLDFKGSNEDPRVSSALDKVSSFTSNLRLLGCYHSEIANQ